MNHKQLEFPMPASTDVVFDAFHYHEWRCRWDSLVSQTSVLGGAPCPFVGAVTENTGAGILSALSMQTRFVSYDRPKLAAATMIKPSFPFTRWAASMRHRNLSPDHSVLVYSYTFEVGPPVFRWFLAPVVHMVFVYQTRKRFTRLTKFLALHAEDVKAWQRLRPEQ